MATVRGLGSIVDLPVRVAAAGERARADRDAFVSELESVLRGSARGSTQDADAFLACALWLLDRGEPSVPELRAIAERDGLALVTAILADAAPHRGLARGGRLSPLDIPDTARVRRYVRARDGGHFQIDGLRYEAPSRTTHDDDDDDDDEPELSTAEDFMKALERLQHEILNEPYALRHFRPQCVQRATSRLGQHQSAFTVGRLLDAPSTRGRDVIAIAARRPTTPAIVRALTSRVRWMLPDVRAAIVANPCSPTRTALLLGATCLPRLRGIAAKGNVHPRVRALSDLAQDS